jgi:hypothetical protein
MARPQLRRRVAPSLYVKLRVARRALPERRDRLAALRDVRRTDTAALPLHAQRQSGWTRRCATPGARFSLPQ